MKRLILLVIAVLATNSLALATNSLALATDTYTIDGAHSSVSFAVKHMMHAALFLAFEQFFQSRAK